MLISVVPTTSLLHQLQYPLSFTRKLQLQTPYFLFFSGTHPYAPFSFMAYRRPCLLNNLTDHPNYNLQHVTFYSNIIKCYLLTISLKSGLLYLKHSIKARENNLTYCPIDPSLFSSTHYQPFLVGYYVHLYIIPSFE